LDELAGSGLGQTELALRPRERCAFAVDEQVVERAAQPAHGLRELRAAPRRLAEPERDVGRLTLRVFREYLSLRDLRDAVRGIAELEDVARDALEREILVQRADLEAFRQQH